MPTANKQLLRIMNRGEWSVRATLLQLWEQQRRGLPYVVIRDNGSIPAELIDRWENEYIKWFEGLDKIWRYAWIRAIELIEIKQTATEFYDDFILERGFYVGHELANVAAEATAATLNTYSTGSWGKLKRELKKSIGLQPKQITALQKQSAVLIKLYGEERASILIERLYQKKLNYRAQLIARTEMSNAVNRAQMASMRERITAGEQSADTEKRWSTVGDNRVSLGCQENESDGWISLNDPFASGHEAPPRFPGCRCGLQYRAARR